ncbi:MAG TPA: hypothetical protein VJ917_02140 [Saprospiraceae bacterium]|nr:hypothetical protein [Saprospiraceae bacterium]
MEIKKTDTIKELQMRFNAAYSHLKLKFYSKGHEEFEGSSGRDEVDTEAHISKVNPNAKDGDIDISENVTVQELENNFEKDFGLHVQVFRKSNHLWLQTSATDDWSLGEQQRKGKNSVQN